MSAPTRVAGFDTSLAVVWLGLIMFWAGIIAFCFTLDLAFIGTSVCGFLIIALRIAIGDDES